MDTNQESVIVASLRDACERALLTIDTITALRPDVLTDQMWTMLTETGHVLAAALSCGTVRARDD